MTYAPQRLLDLRAYLQPRTGLPLVSLGIVGSAGHHAAGTSYHIGWSSLRLDAYSRQHRRDTKLRTEAASATDTGNFARDGRTLVGLTRWAVSEARAGRRPDTREIIGPWGDGRAYRWAVENGWTAQLRARGDSHETHMHESWFRDSEHDDKIRYYRGYFEGDDDMTEEEFRNHLQAALPKVRVDLTHQGKRLWAGELMDRDSISLAEALMWGLGVAVHAEAMPVIALLRGQLAGLTELVQLLATAPPVPVTPEQLAALTAAVERAAAAGAAESVVDALGRTSLTVDPAEG